MSDELVRGVFDAVARRDVAWLVERTSPTVAELLDADRLESALDAIAGAFGEPVSCGAATRFGGPVSGQYSLDCEGERSGFVLVVSVDDDDLITGLNVLPVVEHPRPAYAAAAMAERPLSFGADPEFPLNGTLTAPADSPPWPCVVLVHGSGPNDRDETTYGAKPFLDLALGLAARGVASLRYEKRTRTYGVKVAADVRTEVIDDAVAAVETVAADDDTGSVFVLGHSLGGTLAPAIAARCRKLDGVVIIAGATRPIRDVLRDQVDHLLATTSEGSARASLQRVRASVESDDDLLGVPRDYWMSLEANGPSRTGPTMRPPALVLQGGRDYQVGVADFEGWKHLLPQHPDSRFVLYPDLDHLLATGIGASSPAQYLQPSNVDVRVVKDIADWVHAIARGAASQRSR